MMAIKSRSNRWGSWHVGEDMNIPAGRVITFQVDGHELDWLLSAMAEKMYNDDPEGDCRINYPATHLTPVL